MAQFTPAAAFSFAKNMIKKMPAEQIQPDIMDDPSKMFWMAAPWRWTLGALNAVTLTSNTDDAALGTLPADFLYAYQAWTCSTADDGIPRDLEIVGAIPADTSVRGPATRVAIYGEAGAAGTARFYPAPGTLATGTQLFIIYKKKSPTITKRNMGSATILAFPDEYYPVYKECMMYYAYKYSDDHRAGTATYSDGKVGYGGQLGTAMAMIQETREREKLPILDDRQPGQKGTK